MTATIKTRILNSIRENAAVSNVAWVSILAVRDEVGSFGFEDAVRELVAAKTIRAIPEENQKTITAAKRRHAINISGEDKHLLAIA